MKEQTFDSSVGTSLLASQPHFDDEETVLTARPVVPLEKIDAKLRRRRHWFLGGAFAIAMMLGAASALVASYLRMRGVPESVNEVSQEDFTPVAVAESESPVIENVEEPAPAPSVAPKKESPVKHRTLVKREPDFAEPPSLRQMDEEEELNRIRQAVLVDEWQERRARRATRRERRRSERYNHRDLSNLDEIFEGRKRP
jgi:hypothetical protein